MEDVNDSMTKEIQKTKAKSDRNSVNIAFMDMSKLTPIQKVCYLVFIYGFMAAGTYFFYTMLIKKPEAENAVIQAKKDAKQAKKQKKT